MASTSKLTAKGAATRARIVQAAADLLLAHGVGGTSLDDIRAETATSKSQLFHYFPGGKLELVGAIAAFQGERVLQAQRPFIDTLDTWEAWEGWRHAVVAHYGSQAHWGCPISALASELIGNDAAASAEVEAYMDRWQEYLEAGLARMRAAGVRLLDGIAQLDVIGLIGPRALGVLARRVLALRRCLRREAFDLVVLIDQPGLNFHFARIDMGTAPGCARCCQWGAGLRKRRPSASSGPRPVPPRAVPGIASPA